PLGYREGLAIPADPAGQRPAARSGRVGIAELPLDAPVVRQIEAAPSGIVERRFLSAGDVTQMESPGAVEGQNRPLPLRYRWRELRDQQPRQADDGSARGPRRPATLMARRRPMSAAG